MANRKTVAVDIRVNWERINADLMQNVEDAQKKLDIQVLKDCQPFVPRDSGNLVLSGVRATEPGSGEVVWDAPYAWRQYNELPNKAKDVHPKATIRWFEAAKAAKGRAWIALAKRIGGKR